MGKFVVKTRSNGEYQFNLVAGNGQNILSSEGYSTKTACMNGIESVKTNSPHDERFEKLSSKMASIILTLKQPMGKLSAAAKCMKAKQAGIMA